MKKIFPIVISLLLIITSFSIITNAQSIEDINFNEQIVSKNIEIFDEYYVLVTVKEEFTSLNMQSVQSNSYTKTGSKEYKAYNKDGEVIWKFTIMGNFTVVSGISATCTKATYYSSIVGNGWSLKSGNAYKSSNQAIGDATFQHKTLFIVTDTKNCHVVLSCDSNGNFS